MGELAVGETRVMHVDVEIEGGEAIALRVREELARRRLSRQWLADEARVSLSTLEKALAGRRPSRLATVVRLEDALGTSLRGVPGRRRKPFAPESMGAYARPGRAMAGRHLSHPSPVLQREGAIFAYLTEIAWDDVKGHLVFSEAGRLDANMSRRDLFPSPTCPAPSTWSRSVTANIAWRCSIGRPAVGRSAASW